MDIAQVRRERDRHPFRPFTLRLSDGSVRRVGHPGFMAVAEDYLIVIRPDNDYDLIDPAHIVAVEVAVHAHGNGRRRSG